ncbi:MULTISPECIES: cation:proton antiporter [Desulfococcus]|uniref:Sodium/hydrogen exchanger n=1 Tax=Desulfococcus multivorans DSM 2059 TaxID=1121405 RepID=S7TF38_DESML|nr:cation:proton antiporter [Desulfococcus multivorans]AOY59806.1 Na+/H+ antiporter [Desulfococcus multivorans]AQV01973.1 sodium:proton exchanger [Desulfococcus multivorans]EPR35807.1 sodium/hydrogen exchanger [Desulfococcus multivorans DSM 2059]SJZ33541.1 Kef-type K+ transport system, membrane component KefB [Desulfococcus multivorans DSM 2059]
MITSQQTALLLVVLAILIVPGISRILRVPSMVVEIIFGVILGKSVLKLEFTGEWLPFLAHLGFLLLMFRAGMEIDFTMLKRQSRGQLMFQVLFFMVTLGLATLAATLLSRGFFVALMLSTTSLGLVMPTLRETGMSRTPMGQDILIAATLADFMTLFGITFYVLYIRQGIDWRFFLPIPLFLGFGILLRIGRVWVWWHPAGAERILGIQEDAQEIGVRLSMALLFLFVALSELAHLEPVLGAFLGGSLLAYIFREKPLLETKLSAMGFGFLIPVFFIHVGMQFDLTHIMKPEMILFSLKLLGAAVTVKMAPAALLLFRGRKPREVFQAGVLLSSRLSLIIAAAAIGVENNLIKPEIKDAVVFMALVTCFLGPTLFKLITPTVGSGGPNDVVK